MTSQRAGVRERLSGRASPLWSTSTCRSIPVLIRENALFKIQNLSFPDSLSKLIFLQKPVFLSEFQNGCVNSTANPQGKSEHLKDTPVSLDSSNSIVRSRAHHQKKISSLPIYPFFFKRSPPNSCSVLSSYTQVYSLIYDSGSAPRWSIFSSREFPENSRRPLWIVCIYNLLPIDSLVLKTRGLRTQQR